MLFKSPSPLSYSPLPRDAVRGPSSGSARLLAVHSPRHTATSLIRTSLIIQHRIASSPRPCLTSQQHARMYRLPPMRMAGDGEPHRGISNSIHVHRRCVVSGVVKMYMEAPSHASHRSPCHLWGRPLPSLGSAISTSLQRFGLAAISCPPADGDRLTDRLTDRLAASRVGSVG